MKIITLKGKDNSGKTTALRNLYQKFLKMAGTKKINYCHEGADDSDFTAELIVCGKKIVIKSIGDGISWVRDGLQYAQANNSDVLINAWNLNLDKKYNIQKELPGAIVINNPISICAPLQDEWKRFNDYIISRL